MAFADDFTKEEKQKFSYLFLSVLVIRGSFPDKFSSCFLYFCLPFFSIKEIADETACAFDTDMLRLYLNFCVAAIVARSLRPMKLLPRSTRNSRGSFWLEKKS